MKKLILKVQMAVTLALAVIYDWLHDNAKCFATAAANPSVAAQHAGNITQLAAAAIATRFLLAKIGSDSDHVDVGGASDIPLGVITDESSAAEDPVNVALLGSANTTLKMVASAAISAGDFVVPAASGKIKTLPGAAGTYYIVGRAMIAAGADADVIEVDPIPNTQRVVS